VRAHWRFKIFNAGDKSYFKRPPCVPVKTSCRIAARNYIIRALISELGTSYRLPTFKLSLSLSLSPSPLIVPPVARSSIRVRPLIEKLTGKPVKTHSPEVHGVRLLSLPHRASLANRVHFPRPSKVTGFNIALCSSSNAARS